MSTSCQPVVVMVQGRRHNRPTVGQVDQVRGGRPGELFTDEAAHLCVMMMMCDLLLPQSGTIPANGVVGRLLMETISRVPQMEPSKFEAMLNSTMQVRTAACTLFGWGVGNY